ncbi:PQQ-dependent sugar dehydrogenase [Roseinatronobacter alkalisoli]|uniref:PQQ-dependent sugar dehydrogenase n=1 Tax=Roseinatronobacter alkalisoli TaxID=3028235 RepID=A0ABT5TDX5_9RHOB|nr:PQQ-dependent sugar dehydrogenase [Roseinatronobacter sp. HJB301]MDD7973319.1 PQQ-dependent sugar dehydrogenase [Roseinatronobacter sp. HJB301]
MLISTRRIVATCAVTATLSVPAIAQTAYEAETIATDLNRPWAMAFLPGSNEVIVTKRGGGIVILDQDGAQVQTISGTPDVDTRGQGGLLDIALSPDFAQTGLVYLTWAGRVGGQNSTTHLGRARLDRDAGTLTNLEVLHSVTPAIDSGAHFGSRIVFSDGHVFVGFGDRGSKDFGPDHISQDLSSENGSVIRLTLDGGIPADNPFVDDDGAAGAIWSYGHRNIQAMTIHPQTGEIWLAEHGEAGGDEVNIVTRGGNYGWPLAANGVTYRGGQRFAEPHQEGDGFVAPVHVWPAGREDHFPPSGMTFYTGDAFPDWQGHLLIGNLFHEYLGLFTEENGTLEPVARLLDGEGHRIRDVAVHPQNGSVYVLADGENAPLIRLTPAP